MNIPMIFPFRSPELCVLQCLVGSCVLSSLCPDPGQLGSFPSKSHQGDRSGSLPRRSGCGRNGFPFRRKDHCSAQKRNRSHAPGQEGIGPESIMNREGLSTPKISPTRLSSERFRKTRAFASLSLAKSKIVTTSGLSRARTNWNEA